MSNAYIQPGFQPPPPQPIRANTYVPPTGLPPQMEQQPPAPLPEPPVRHQDHPPDGLFAEWHRHHGYDWLRADDLNPAVRRMIDPQDRTAAIRQKLPRLVDTLLSGFKLETKVVGSAARPTMLYRVVTDRP